MSAHMTCLTADLRPSAFPAPRPVAREYAFPASRPAAREYANFMASEYQASSVMNNFNPSSAYASGGPSQAYEALEDEIPVLSKPVPTVTAALRTRYSVDPSLTVTPERKSPVHGKYSQVSARRMPPGMDADLCLTPEPAPLGTGSRRAIFTGFQNSPLESSGVLLPSPESSLTNTKEFLGSSRTVRFDQTIEVRQMSPHYLYISHIRELFQQKMFDQTIEVRQMSPQSSIVGSSLSLTNTPPTPPQDDTRPKTTVPLPLQNTSNTSPRNPYSLDSSLNDSVASYNSAIHRDYVDRSSIKRNDYNSELTQERTAPKQSEVIITDYQRHGSGIGYTTNVSYLSGNGPGSLSSNSFSSAASDGSSRLDSLGSQGSVEAEGTEAIEVIASDLRHGSRGRRGDVVALARTGDRVVESVLARAEFSSTLRVRKEMTQLQEADVDLARAVQNKLKTSEKTKVRLNEKACSYVNQEEFQFGHLPGVEVIQEDAILIAEENITSKAKPAPISRSKPEHGLRKAPDLMEFFHRKLERETAGYGCPGVPRVQNKPRTAQPNTAFDVYRHIRAWENW